MPEPSDAEIERTTLSRIPAHHCQTCGQRAWKRTCLVAGTGGGLSIRSVVYQECGCGRVELPRAPV